MKRVDWAGLGWSWLDRPGWSSAGLGLAVGLRLEVRETREPPHWRVAWIEEADVEDEAGAVRPMRFRQRRWDPRRRCVSRRRTAGRAGGSSTRPASALACGQRGGLAVTSVARPVPVPGPVQV